MSDQPITNQYLDEIEVRAEVAAANLRKYLPPMQDMMDLIGSADGTPFGFGRYPVWTEPEPYVMDEAAKAIDKLVAEVRRLRAELQNAEPVVRCKECRNSSQIASDIADRMRHCWNGRGRSTGDGFSRVKQDGYCDEGERMDATRAEATDADGRGN